MFEVVSEPLPGVKILAPKRVADARGEFVKTMHEGALATLGIQFIVREEFFSVSSRGVLRGMHFQSPPHDHQKIVYCPNGRVLDVLLDLRKASGGYGRCASFELSQANRHLVYIPKGIAHGFLTLEDDSLMLYKTDTVHQPSYDTGIRWDSFGFAWPVEAPIISPRDQKHPPFPEFVSPF